MKTIYTIFIFAFLGINPLFAQSDTASGSNLYFDGSTNYVDTRDTSLYRSFTVECWVKSPNAPNSDQGKGPVHYEKNFQINWDHVQSSARSSLVLNVTNGGWQAASFGPLEGNTWYHLAGTYDGDTLRTYTNGRLVTQKIINGGPPARETFSLKIGKHAKLSGVQEYFRGNVDEVRVWNVARTPEQIRMFMHHPLIGNETGLKHYYRFNTTDLQGDSTLNRATGKWVRRVNSPEIRPSEFPFGSGKSTVFKVVAGQPQIHQDSNTGLVSMVTDSANRDFPLLFTHIKDKYYGLVPDSQLYAPQVSPYWIIQPLDTGVRWKTGPMRLDGNALQASLTPLITRPGDIQVFHRPHTSFGNWSFSDTCDAIAWGTGHYIFKGFVPGQISLGLSSVLTGLESSKGTSGQLKIWSPGSDNRTFHVHSPGGFQEFEIFNLQGKKIQAWTLDSDTPSIRLTTSRPLEAGMYLLLCRGKGKALGTRFLIF